MEKVVRVVVAGGVVQHVEVPKGVLVVVSDYDVGDCDPALLERDGNGDLFIEGIWESEEP
jgi:hypothetical protein